MIDMDDHGKQVQAHCEALRTRRERLREFRLKVPAGKYSERVVVDLQLAEVAEELFQWEPLERALSGEE